MKKEKMPDQIDHKVELSEAQAAVLKPLRKVEQPQVLGMPEILERLRRNLPDELVSRLPDIPELGKKRGKEYLKTTVVEDLLDSVCADDWEYKILAVDQTEEGWLCRVALRIGQLTREGMGYIVNKRGKEEIGPLLAEEMAFKRAARRFGIGRSLKQSEFDFDVYDAARGEVPKDKSDIANEKWVENWLRDHKVNMVNVDHIRQILHIQIACNIDSDQWFDQYHKKNGRSLKDQPEKEVKRILEGWREKLERYNAENVPAKK